jgi:hypothetical protein
MTRRRLFVLVLLGSALATAQQGIDFFEAPGAPFIQELSYRFGVKYQPDGGMFVRPDGEGQEAVIVAAHALQATLQLSYSIDPTWAVDVFGAAGFSRTSQRQVAGVLPASASATAAAWQATFKVGAGLGHTFSGGGSLRPTLYLQASWPVLRLETNLSASLLRDPVLLRGMIGVAFQPSEPGIDLLLEVNTTFLANDVVSFGGSVGLTVPLTSARFTQTEITVHTAYDYGRQSPAWVTTSIGFTLSGSNIGFLVSADISGDKTLRP